MAYTNTAYKVLGQLAPASGVYTGALYTVPASTGTVVSTILVTNRATTTDTFRIRVAVGNASSDNKQWAWYDVPVKGTSTLPLHVGMTLNATDVLYVGSNGGNLTFQAYGSELS